MAEILLLEKSLFGLSVKLKIPSDIDFRKIESEALLSCGLMLISVFRLPNNPQAEMKASTIHYPIL